MESVIFVFYTIRENAPNKNWTYSRFPSGWNWTGAGSTSALNEPVKEFQREEQFNGPKNNRLAMKNLLIRVFDTLKRKDVITKYKIRFSYKP